MLAILGNVNDGRNNFTAIISSVFADLLADSGITRRDMALDP